MLLNKHGWGLSEMIICSAILIIALFFVVFYSFQFAKKENTTDNTVQNDISEKIDYEEIERKIRDSALKYMDLYYQEDIGSGTFTIPVYNLIYYNLLTTEDLAMDKNDVCDGYALVKQKEYENLEVEAYIKCKKYMTNAYEEWKTGEEDE